MNLARDWLLNLDLRNIGALPNPASPSYTELNARIGWTVSPSVEISLTGSNLIHPHHLEFGTTSPPCSWAPPVLKRDAACLSMADGNSKATSSMARWMTCRYPHAAAAPSITGGFIAEKTLRERATR